MTRHDRIGFTRLTARDDGVIATCAFCGRDTHYGVRIETVRDHNDRRITLFACYDCIDVCHLIAVGRMPCAECNGQGFKGPPVSGP